MLGVELPQTGVDLGCRLAIQNFASNRLSVRNHEPVDHMPGGSDRAAAHAKYANPKTDRVTGYRTGEPAISPHAVTGIPASIPASTTSRIAPTPQGAGFGTIQLHARYHDRLLKDIGRRSLVPRQIKSTSFAISFAVSTADAYLDHRHRPSACSAMSLGPPKNSWSHSKSLQTDGSAVDARDHWDHDGDVASNIRTKYRSELSNE